jgi:mono/diheme cytochrome c family protein
VDWLNTPGVSEHPGLTPFQTECGKCHVIEGLNKEDDAMRDAPQLFGWGSPQWIAHMVRKPRSSDRYGFLDAALEHQMPAFGPDRLRSADLDVLIRYIKGDYVPPAPER